MPAGTTRSEDIFTEDAAEVVERPQELTLNDAQLMPNGRRAPGAPYL